MAKLSTVVATTHRLWLTSMEEVSRSGGKDAGVEHLLLALTLDDGDAGQVLRSLGVTIESAREAVSAQHAAQLASIGLDTTSPAPGKISFDGATGYEWTDAAQKVLSRAAARRETGDTGAVLRALLVEPSGFVEHVLERIGTSADAVAERLDQAAPLPASVSPRRSDPLSRSTTAFVPASIDATWALISDPRRLGEWDPTVYSVEEGPSGTWVSTEAADDAGGRSRELGPMHVTVEADPAQQIARWTFSWPAARRANRRHVVFALEPAAAGTMLRIDAKWERRSPHPHPRRRRIAMALLRPVFRGLLWVQVTRIGSSVSAALRG